MCAWLAQCIHFQNSNLLVLPGFNHIWLSGSYHHNFAMKLRAERFGFPFALGECLTHSESVVLTKVGLNVFAHDDQLNPVYISSQLKSSFFSYMNYMGLRLGQMRIKSTQFWDVDSLRPGFVFFDKFPVEVMVSIRQWFQRTVPIV